MSRRHMLTLAAGSALGAPAIIRPAQAQSKTVYVNSYGGVWEKSWKKAFFDPFTAQTGIEIKTVPGVLVRQAQGAGAEPRTTNGT